MTYAGTRAEAEQELANALSRQIGYTSGAYDLVRIFSVLDVFRGTASAFKEEITEHLKQVGAGGVDEANSDTYSAEIINFAQSMHLIESVSSREARLQRFALTESGRSMLGVRGLEDREFFRYYATKIVLLADADYLFPVLKFCTESSGASLQKAFVDFQVELRERRVEWLLSAFPEPLLLERVVRHISWVKQGGGVGKKLRFDIPTMNTARHHVTPRIGWLDALGLRERDAQVLTSFGNAILQALEPCPPYFWLPPRTGVEEALRVNSHRGSDCASEDNVLFSNISHPPSDSQLSALLQDVSEVMQSSFQDAKLIHAKQASLMLPIEYINYRSYEDNVAYKWEEVLERLFSENKATFQRYSAHKGKVGFYRMSAEDRDG